MSDLSDLVHQATLDTIERVRREEQERIIKLLEKLDDDPCYVCGDLSKAIELIKGETNE